MQRVLVFILLIIFLSGCAAAKDPKLTIKDKNLLDQWMYAADVSYRIGDYRLCLEYYTRIVDRYPDSESARVAERKIKILRRVLKKVGETDF